MRSSSPRARLVATSLVALAACGPDLTTTTHAYDTRFGADQLDIIDPAGRTSTGAVLYVHGGAWESGSRHNDGRIVERIARLGYLGVNVDYRLTPDGAYPAAVQDIHCALAYVRAHAGELAIDPAKIVVMGHSAGGHLVDMVGVDADLAVTQDADCPSGTTTPPLAVISVAGPTDLTQLDAAATEAFVGVSLASDEARWQEASPITHVRPQLPPFLFVHSQQDLIVPVDQSERMNEALRAAGNESALLRLEGGGHVFGDGAGLGYEQFELASDTPEAWLAITDFLARTLGAP